VTGLRLFVDGLSSKQLELVLDLNPGATKIGPVVNPDNANSPSQRQELETAVAAKAIKIATIEVRAPENVDSIFPTLAKERVDAVIVLRDTLFFTQRARLAASAMAVRLPTVYGFREHVEEGGLISYGISLPENFRRAADYVVKILKGAKPGDLPIEFPTKLELVINLDCEGARHRRPTHADRARRRGDRVNRRLLRCTSSGCGTSGCPRWQQ
jgi:putative tryptophan/tyrosine transport system substrate-binding protein